MSFLGGCRGCLPLRMHLRFGALHWFCLPERLASPVETLLLRRATAMVSSFASRRRASLASVHRRCCTSSGKPNIIAGSSANNECKVEDEKKKQSRGESVVVAIERAGHRVVPER